MKQRVFNLRGRAKHGLGCVPATFELRGWGGRRCVYGPDRQGELWTSLVSGERNVLWEPNDEYK